MSQLDLRQHSVCMIVFVMHGCGHCDEYTPRLQRLATPMLRQGFPILVYYADDQRPDIQAMMDAYGVQATPTTVLTQLRNGQPYGQPTVIESAIDDAGIVQLLGTAQRYFVPPR